MNLPTQLSFLFCLPILLGMSSCSSKQKAIKLEPDVVKYSLRTGSCFGTCPIYTLSIYEGGKAVLKAGKFIKPEGTSEKMLDASTYGEIEQAFAKSAFFSYPDTFPSMIPDLPSIWISYNDGTQEKTIYGKEDRPDDIIALQEMLHAVAKGPGWISTKPAKKAEKKPEGSMIYDQLIVQPHEGKLTEDWISRYKEYGLKLERKISPDLEYYLLSYDDTSIDPKEMLEKIKSDPAIRLAEFDKKIDSRGATKGKDR